MRLNNNLTEGFTMKQFIILGFIIALSITSCKENSAGFQIPGGWKKISVNSLTVLKAYEFLKTNLHKKNPQIKLLKVIQAKRQIVAGSNVGLTCSYQKGTKATKQILYAKIYKNLLGKYKLVKLDYNNQLQPPKK